MNWELGSFIFAIAAGVCSLTVILFSYQAGKVKDDQVKKAQDKVLDAQSKLLAKNEEIKVSQEKLIGLQNRLIEKSEELSSVQSKLLMYTAADDNCYVTVINLRSSNPSLGIANRGKYPIYDVHVVIFNYNELDKAIASGAKEVSTDIFLNKDIGTLHAGQGADLAIITLSDDLRLGLTITTRTKRFYERIVFRKNKNNEWVRAYILTDMTIDNHWKKIEENVPSDFLRDGETEYKFPIIYTAEVMSHGESPK
ncbi:hypothetical protein SAMN05428975_5837 [Mucilaginibacter sp. OK268]|nr:hypothetical protein SAMN05428975_5837 [Mucilaginibacter sp. OK268]